MRKTPDRLRTDIFKKKLEESTNFIAFASQHINDFRYCPKCGGELYRKVNDFFCDSDYCDFRPLIVIKEDGK